MKTKYQFEDFFTEVSVENRDFVSEINRILVNDGYKVRIDSKASGFLVSYAHPKTKRSIVNFLFRKTGLQIRIYADKLSRYAGFIDRLPEKMELEIRKAPACKRLINPDDCNPKCITGYDFFIKDNRYKKCRYCCFQFAVTPESKPVLSAFVENERKERME